MYSGNCVPTFIRIARILSKIVQKHLVSFSDTLCIRYIFSGWIRHSRRIQLLSTSFWWTSEKHERWLSWTLGVSNQ